MGEPGDSVEKEFKRALEVAKKQEAGTFEIRAAMDLARLWQQQGKSGQAKRLLKECYDLFTEGFDSVDLQEARTLLSAL